VSREPRERARGREGNGAEQERDVRVTPGARRVASRHSKLGLWERGGSQFSTAFPRGGRCGRAPCRRCSLSLFPLPTPWRAPSADRLISPVRRSDSRDGTGEISLVSRLFDERARARAGERKRIHRTCRIRDHSAHCFSLRSSRGIESPRESRRECPDGASDSGGSVRLLTPPMNPARGTRA